MANEQNLRPIQSLSSEEAKKRGRKGGKASAASRRRRKSLRENMDLLLDMDVVDPEDFNSLMEMGLPAQGADNAMLLTVGLFKKAKNGDVAAFKEIRELIGEDGDEDSGDLQRLITGLKNE